MDFVNSAVAQLSELFRSMTPGARVTAGLLLTVVIVSMGYLFQQGSTGPDAFLFGGEPLSDGQLTSVEAAIAEAGLNGWVREGNRIRVPYAQQADYLAAVAVGGALPPNFNTILEKSLEKGGYMESGETTRQRLKNAKQQTLSEIVRTMDWVEDAIVIYDEQQARGLNPQKQVTGSVSVKPAFGESLDPRRVQMLQKLVAACVIGMRPDDITVTNLNGGGIVGSNGEDFPAELFKDEYYQIKVAFEQQKKSSILSALRDIPGVRVEVNAELDDVMQETQTNLKFDPKPATSREMTTAEKSIQSTTSGGGRPGVTVQGPGGQGATEVAQRQNQNETTNETTETEFQLSQDTSTVLRKGYTPKEVQAIVTIPSSYIESVWKQRNPAAAEAPKKEDLDLVESQIVTKVENVVEPLLTLRMNKGDPYQRVRVVVVDTLAAPEFEAPTMASTALAWTGRYWSTLAMLGVAMFSLMVLRSAVKASPTRDGIPPATAASTLTLHADDLDSGGKPDAPEDDVDRPRLRLKKGKSLKDDLVEIVREDPDAAADILRSWIGKAG